MLAFGIFLGVSFCTTIGIELYRGLKQEAN